MDSEARPVTPASRYAELLRARWALSAAIATVALGAFVKITSELREGELDELDRAVLEGVVALRVPRLDASAIDLTALGSSTVLTLVWMIASVLFLLGRDLRGCLQLLLTAAGAALWTTLLKQVLERERPALALRLIETSGFSYPSGHSLASASLYLAMALLVSRHLAHGAARVVCVGMAALLALVIGASRAYLGVHYPSDILAGLLLGASWTLSISAVFSYLRAKS